MHYYLGLEVW
jgi:hypothetical protein